MEEPIEIKIHTYISGDSHTMASSPPIYASSKGMPYKQWYLMNSPAFPIRACVRVDMHVHVYVCVRVYVCIHVCVCVHGCVCVCVYVFVCVFA